MTRRHVQRRLFQPHLALPCALQPLNIASKERKEVKHTTNIQTSDTFFSFTQRKTHIQHSKYVGPEVDAHSFFTLQQKAKKQHIDDPHKECGVEGACVCECVAHQYTIAFITTVYTDITATTSYEKGKKYLCCSLRQQSSSAVHMKALTHTGVRSLINTTITNMDKCGRCGKTVYPTEK